MARYIETKEGLETLLKRMRKLQKEVDDELPEFKYWEACVKGCIEEKLAMDEVDYENAPVWFRRLWTCLK